MDSLSTDVMVFELGQYLLPFERLKLCGVSKTLNSVFNLSTSKVQPSQLTYDAEFYSEHLASVFHDGVLDLAHDAILKLTDLQLHHLQYLVICHRTLLDKYSSLHSSSPIARSLLCALRSVHTVNLQHSAMSFATRPYASTFLCHLLRCGFTAADTSANSPTPILSEVAGLELKLSACNLNSTHLSLICRALLSRKSPLRVSRLELSKNQISDRAMRSLLRCVGRRCPRLESIDCSYANVTDASCDAIAAFYDRYALRSKLHSIDLSFTRVSESGLATLDALFDELATPEILQGHAPEISFEVKLDGCPARNYATLTSTSRACAY